MPISWALIKAPRVISSHQQTRLTYEALDRQSGHLANGLLRLGVKKGERVAVSLGNSVEYAVVGTKLILDVRG